MSEPKTREWLRETLLVLPEKRRNKNVTGALTRYLTMAEESRDSLVSALHLGALVTLVFRDCKLPTLSDRVHKAGIAARTCQKDLAKGIQTAATKTFEERMISIKESAKTASDSVSEHWATKLSAAVRAYEQIGKIAADRALPGGPELDKKLRQLSGRASLPPKDEKDAKALALTLKGLPQEIKSLGLAGKAGVFLVAAAEGRASARDLDDPEVRDLLDRYGLWKSLLVSLGPQK